MLQRAITVPLPGPHENAKQYLEAYGFEPPTRLDKREKRLVLVSALALGAIFGLWWFFPSLEATNIALFIIGLDTLILGYFHWRDARHEVSLDKYYERLDLANRRQDGNHIAVHRMMQPCLPELAGEPHEVLMYVYVELDNLEYVIEKYGLGYMTEEHACRGLKTFQLRCWSEQFRRIARHRVHAGDYRKGTAVVVDRVCDEVEKLVGQQYQPAADSGADRRQTARRASDLYLASGFKIQQEAAASDPVQPKDNGHAPGLPAQEDQAAQS